MFLNRKHITTAMFVVSFHLLGLCPGSIKTMVALEKFQWSLSKLKNGDMGLSEKIPLKNTITQVSLLNGWSCEVGPIGDFGGRQTACKKGEEEMSFSVQCDQNKPNDHVQIRFKLGSIRDLIHLGCSSVK